MAAAFFGRNKFFDLIAKKQHAHFIIILYGRKCQHGTKLGCDILLLLILRSKVFGPAHINQQHKGKLAFLVKNLHVRMVKTSGHVPVDSTDLIAQLVFAHFAKSHTTALESKGTNVAEALKFFTRAIKKRCTAFIISDFISPAFDDELKIANKKHDLIALRLYDKREEEFPNLGLIPMKDEETGELLWVNTSDEAVRTAFKAEGLRRNGQLKETFNRSGVDFTSIGTHESYVKPLMTLFKKREGKR